MSNQETEQKSPSEAEVVAKFKEDGEGLLGQISSIEIKDQEDYEAAKVTRDAIGEAIKERTDWIKPRKATAKQGWQYWVDLEKDLCTVPERAKGILGSKMSAWFQEEQRKAAEKEAELRAKAAEQDLDPDLVQVEAPKVKGQRKVYKYRVVDFSKLPDEYKIEDSKKLGALARSSQGTAEVPGVEFKVDTVTTS
jgi:hypothetical protein